MLRPTSFIVCAFLCVFVTVNADAPTTLVHELNEENWREILQGEWMVEFYAPWCPACSALEPAWRELSLRADSKLGVNTAAIDVTKSAGLSGRFFVTALPTIYHVKNGEFRQYKGSRDAGNLMQWLETRRWRDTEPLSAWKSPDSPHMALLAWFFRLSAALRGIHTMLMETYGLPVWGSYLIFALATILIGAILGLLLVCCVDAIMPARTATRSLVEENKPEQIISEDLVDEAESDAQSSEEENSGSQPSSEDNAQEVCGDGAGGGVRKRRARKAE